MLVWFVTWFCAIEELPLVFWCKISWSIRLLIQELFSLSLMLLSQHFAFVLKAQRQKIHTIQNPYFALNTPILVDGSLSRKKTKSMKYKANLCTRASESSCEGLNWLYQINAACTNICHGNLYRLVNSSQSIVWRKEVVDWKRKIILHAQGGAFLNAWKLELNCLIFFQFHLPAIG